jgi:hypothetical protein
MSIDSCDALVGAWLQQLARDELLHGEDDSIFASDTDGGSTVLYGLHGVLDLEVSSIGGKDGVGKIITGTYRRLEAGESAMSFNTQ